MIINLLKFPHIEVLVRKIYWNNKVFKCIVKYFYSIIYKNNKTKYINVSKLEFLERFEMMLIKCGIKQGEIIIVHSNTDFLNYYKISPELIINVFKKVIGDTGTLVMPAFPIFKKREKINSYDTYDIEKSYAWTGLLPNTMLKLKDSIRSRCPVNPLVANGREATSMMKNNIYGDLIYAHGELSSWKYCVDKKAKIIGIGLNLEHSLTIIHVAEDCRPKMWPKYWYKERKYVIKEKQEEYCVSILERNKFTAKYIAEKKMRADFLKNNIIKTDNIYGVSIEVAEADNIINYIYKNKNKYYPYYI